MNKSFNLQDVIDYIENNLTKKIELKDFAESYGISYSYLSNCFTTIFNMNIKTYITNRKLTLAAQDIANTSESILDIAFKYNYSSTENFSRAIKAFHKLTPTAIRQTKQFKDFSKFTVETICAGGTTMKTTCKHVEKLRLQCVKTTLNKNLRTSRILGDIDKFWKNSSELRDKLYENSITFGNFKKIYVLIKIIDNKTYEYYIGYETKTDLGESSETITIEDCDYTTKTTPEMRHPEFYDFEFLEDIKSTKIKNKFYMEIYYWYLVDSDFRDKRYVEYYIPLNK